MFSSVIILLIGFLTYFRSAFLIRIRPLFKSITTSTFLTKTLPKMNWSASSKFSTTRKLLYHQVQCGEELGITKFREALVYSRYRVPIFYSYRVQVAKVATKPKLPPFFFAITTPQAHGDFQGSIMSYSSNISIFARHAFDLCGAIRLAPSLCLLFQFNVVFDEVRATNIRLMF